MGLTRLVLVIALSLLCQRVLGQQQPPNATSSDYGGSEGEEGTVVGSGDDARRAAEEQRERQRLQTEARKRRRKREKEREGFAAAKLTLQAASSEACDWRGAPMAALRGRVCGVHYKVLGLDRLRSPDKADIKKSYRLKSLALHPDKNHAPEASTAFKIVQDAYECLVSDECKESYDEQLRRAEMQIALERDHLRNQIVQHSLQGLSQLHYYVSVASNHIYQAGLDIWDLAGEVEMNIFGASRPVGRVVLGALLFLKGRVLLQLHGLAYLIVRINFELAKSRGLL